MSQTKAKKVVVEKYTVTLNEKQLIAVSGILSVSFKERRLQLLNLMSIGFTLISSAAWAFGSEVFGLLEVFVSIVLWSTARDARQYSVRIQTVDGHKFKVKYPYSEVGRTEAVEACRQVKEAMTAGPDDKAAERQTAPMTIGKGTIIH